MNEFLLGFGFINIASMKEVLSIIGIVVIVVVSLGVCLSIKTLVQRKGK